MVSFTAIAGLALLGSTLYALNLWSQDLTADPSERKVMATLFYTILGGTGVNAVCAAMAWSVSAVALGEEWGACSPYGLAGSAISARLHMYRLSGYGPREWAVVRNVPQIAVGKLGFSVDKLLDRLDDELLNRGILKTRPGQARRDAAQAQKEQLKAEL